MPGHDIKDDTHKVIDWTARSLRPFMGDHEEFWSKQPRKVKPVLENLRDSHLTKTPTSAKLAAKLHDRGAEITLKMFY